MRVEVESLPIGEYVFPGPHRDQLVAAILAGEKTSTTGLIVDYVACGEALPTVGGLEAVVDSDGRRVCVTENVAVTRCRVGDIGLDHAIAEGEGYSTVEEWRVGHERFWHSVEFREAIGDLTFTVSDDTEAVCQEFRVIWRAESTDPAQAARS